MASPDKIAEQLAALGGADVVLELIGAQNLESDLGVLAVKGRIVVVGTPGGAEGSHLAARADGQAGQPVRHHAAGQAARGEGGGGTGVRPVGRAAAGGGPGAAEFDRVFPAAEAAAAFDYLVQPGKSGKVLLDFG